jgi:hypothetical protein
MSNVVAATDELIATPEVPERFSVNDDSSANWVVRKILEARAYARHCQEWCERELARARRDEEFFLFRFGRQLEEYAKEQIEREKGRRKSVNLPAGTIGFRKEGPKLVVDDEAVVIAWAKQHLPDAVQIVERLTCDHIWPGGCIAVT